MTCAEVEGDQKRAESEPEKERKRAYLFCSGVEPLLRIVLVDPATHLETVYEVERQLRWWLSDPARECAYSAMPGGHSLRRRRFQVRV
jgi:hypothetical protein